MKLLILLFLATTSAAQSEENPLEKIKVQDSVLYTFLNPKEKKAFLQYSPADPDKRVIIDGSFNMTTIIYTTEGNEGEYWGLTASYETGQIFVNNYLTPTLLEYKVNTEELKSIFQDMTKGVENLAFDRVTKTLYWTDSIVKCLMAADSTYRHFKCIYRSDIVSPYALAVHVTKRKLIFSVYLLQSGFVSKSQLIKTDLDGGNMEVMFSFPDVIQVNGLTIDYSNDKLYWTDIDRFQNTIVQSCNFDGTGRKEFFSQSSGAFWGIAHYKDLFYVTDITNISSTQYQIHIRYDDGYNGKRIFKTMRPRNVAIYGENEVSKTKIPNECDGNKCDHICLAGSKGKYTCKCSPGYQLEKGRRCTSDVLDDNYLLMADIGQKRLFQMKLTEFASQVRTFSAMPYDDKTDEKIFSVTVDPSNGEIAWYDLDSNMIHWGSYKFYFYSKGVVSMAVDPIENSLFWASSSTIYMRTASGFTNTRLFSLPFISSAEIRQIAIDYARKQVYWTYYDQAAKESSVWRMDYDGTNRVMVLDSLPPIKPIKIDYETYTLYVSTMATGMLYGLPLKQLGSIPSTSPDYTMYKKVDFGRYLVKGRYLIYDIEIVNGYLYLVDSLSSHLRRFNLKRGPFSMENYGPSDFYFMSTITFYNQRHYKKYIAPLGTGISTTTTIPTTTTIKPITKGPSRVGSVDCDKFTGVKITLDNLNDYITCLLSGLLR